MLKLFNRLRKPGIRDRCKTKPMRNKFLVVTFSLFLLIITFDDVHAQKASLTKTVEVLGTGVIKKNDIASAREQAIADGLASAIARVAADHLPLEALVRNFQRLNETLYHNTNQFIRDYKVLTEARSGDNYRVMIQVTVSIEGVLKQLSIEGMMLGKKAMPRILFVIAEQNIGDSPSEYWGGEEMALDKSVAESAMVPTMRKKGFLVMDRGDMIHNLKDVVLNCWPDFDNKEVVELGSRLTVDVVIVGKSIADIAPNTMGEDIKSFKGIVAARAIKTDTGEVIGATTQTFVSVNTDEITGSNASLYEAGTIAGEELSSQIVTAWQKDTRVSTMVELIIEGTGNLSNFIKFRRMLNKIPGVNEIQTREMKADEVIITVDFEGDASTLANSMLLKTFDTFGINISKVSPNLIKIRLVPG